MVKAATAPKRHLPLPLIVLVTGFVIAYIYPAWVEPQQSEVTQQTPGMVDTGKLPRAGQIAPDFALARADGSVVRLSDFRDRPVVLNFWAGWCTDCQQEMADMQRVADLYGDALVVVGVNAGDPIEVGEQLAKRAGISYERLYDLNLDVTDGYGVRAMPTTCFIDADGKIVDFSLGTLDYESMLEKVTSAAGPPSAP